LNEAVSGDGEALLSTGSQASKNAFSDTRFFSFRVPFKPIAALVPNVEDYLCRRIRRRGIAVACRLRRDPDE
jgi:hypothetical protein